MEQKTFTADELDLIVCQELVENHGINVGRLLNFLDSGELSAYERKSGELEPIYPSMEPKKWEKISGRKIPNSFPEEGLDVLSERKAEYRRLTNNEIGGLTPETVTPLYFSRAEIEVLTGEETESSYSATAKTNLKLHVMKMVKDGLIISKDDLFKDRVINSFMSDPKLDWGEDTIIRYTQRCGIPEKKRGRKPMK